MNNTLLADPLKRGQMGLALIAASFIINPAAGVVVALLAAHFAAKDLRFALEAGLASESDWPLMGIMFGMVVALFAVFRPFPPDDLAKSMVMWAYDFDYAKAYWTWPDHAPKFNIYILYDKLVSSIYLQFPRSKIEYAPLVMQLTALVAFLALFIGALRLRMDKIPGDRDAWMVMLVMLTLAAGMEGRIILARAEVLMAIWGLAALVAFETYTAVWIMVGLAMIPFYWLSPVYAAYALLLPNRSWVFRVVTAVGLAVAGCAFWYYYSNGQWLEMMLSGNVSVGEYKQLVTEFKSIFVLFLQPATIAMLAIGVFFWHRSGYRRPEIAVTLVLVWFLLPNMVRYVSSVAPLIAILVADQINNGYKDREWRNPLKYGGLALVVVMAFSVSKRDQANKIEIPQELQGRVFSTFNSAMYHGMFFNPGAKFGPTMAVGWNTKEASEAMDTLARKQKLNCEFLLKNEVTAVVENTLVGEAMPCLEIVNTRQDYRVWKVVR